jgi:hypothetical protein
VTLPKDPTKHESYCKRMSEIATGNKNCVGRILSEESKEKMSESAKKRCTPEWRLRHSKKVKGRKHTEEEKIKISLGGKGIKKNPDTKLKMSIAAKNRSPEHNRKIALAKTNPSLETRRKMSIWQLGENNPGWKGGISFEPYCPKFNREFKERVRSFFNYQCVECGTPQNGKKLKVHHVNFDKQACCNNTTPLFVPLCGSCHSRTNSNRGYWEQHFTNMINQYYGGRCYLMKNEYPQIEVVLAGGD